MRKEILNPDQTELLPLLRAFARDYYLAGGTAIALYLGHRRSIDFDLFTTGGIKKQSIKKTIDNHNRLVTDLLFEDSDQIHLVIDGVKVTFCSFPYDIEKSVTFEDYIDLPDLLTLAAMKALALGGRAKWKDYVDLYFLLRDHFSLHQVSMRSKDLFGAFFNEKLFREQLCYFADIDYSEKIAFVAQPVPDSEIKQFLRDVATTGF
ncbi:MAG: nucleotidyl transferase AbiEii/AbiGii toxin family protein [Syntrophales bacterium]|jgi:hypothetical protein|nr:nucleotidyl transferase AbiEii/AbiGii toxin family protein [Syntrophales bacterium]MDX9922764.1 nucleotidyl transferase AbiEii/AbiGii toxin family protein [Syntrophales bacterium]